MYHLTLSTHYYMLSQKIFCSLTLIHGISCYGLDCSKPRLTPEVIDSCFSEVSTDPTLKRFLKIRGTDSELDTNILPLIWSRCRLLSPDGDEHDGLRTVTWQVTMFREVVETSDLWCMMGPLAGPPVKGTLKGGRCIILCLLFLKSPWSSLETSRWQYTVRLGISRIFPFLRV